MKFKKHTIKIYTSLFLLSGLSIIFPISLHQNMNTGDETPIPSLETSEGQVIDLNLGGNSSAITLDTTNDGNVDSLYMWGNNEYGQLGLGDNTDYNTPQKVFFNEDMPLFNLEQGSYHSGAAIDTTGDNNPDTLYMWGKNTFGELGLGSTKVDDFYNTPQEVTKLPEGTIIELELGEYTSSVIIDTTGDGMADTLYTWGYNINGELGIGDFNYHDTPKEVTNLPEGELVDLEMGYHHGGIMIDTTEDGKADSLYMWGSNFYNQIGNGGDNSDDVNIPEQITINLAGDLIDLSLGGYSSSISIDTTQDGKADSLCVWGRNFSGQLGLGNNETYPIPEELTTLPEGTIINFEMGFSHSGATIDTTGNGKADSLYMWGDNEFGQLGLGDNTGYYSPQEIDMNGIGAPVNLQLGENNTGLMIDTTGNGKGDTLYMWGANESGQLGLGDNIDYNTPQNIGFFIEFPSLSVKGPWFYIILVLVILFTIAIIIGLILFLFKFISKQTRTKIR
ncbi:MAG: hypothetical protein GQ557_01230 [Mycoplasmataceae bacterium]|nr:hypothetical protein [Mycoplasmataceae bacterium]